MTTFESLGLTEPVLKALKTEGYTVPTPIQAKAVPHVLAGRDLFGCAQTGTGKTAAFALPLIERMMANPRERTARRCRVLVLAPTRELAGQIHESFRVYGRNAHLKTAVIYGGVGQRPQETAMSKGVDVLVATPGRLLDLVQQKFVDLRAVEFLVLDEADRMLDMGFIHDVRRIVGMLPKERQTLFFSATLPSEVRQLADSMLRDPLEVKTTPQSTPAETVSQSVFFLAQRQKRHLLVHLLSTEEMVRVIVFMRTKHGADKLQRDLDRAGIRAAAIHGNKSQNQREKALAAFKSQHPPVLIATDIAARGIDVDNVSHVVNYELPHEPETYVHRIGRTGRAGMTGKAVSLCDHEERPRLQAIERLLRKSIPVRNDLPELPHVEAASEPRERNGGGSRSPQGRPPRDRSGEGGRGGQGGSSRGKGGGGGRNDGRRSSGGQQQRQGAQASRRPRSESSQGESRPGGTATGATAAAPAAPTIRKIKKHRRAL
ncbi:MAG: DEAD/DEAH box helicase [Planctomycetia bacterium]|nr:DEAD/DEAH box helicase [Planctomycetia bacterium]